MTSLSIQHFPDSQTDSSAIQHRFQGLHSELESYRANIPFPLHENRKFWKPLRGYPQGKVFLLTHDFRITLYAVLYNRIISMPGHSV